MVIHPEDYFYSSAKFYMNGVDAIGMLTDYREYFGVECGHKGFAGGDEVKEENEVKKKIMKVSRTVKELPGGDASNGGQGEKFSD